MGVIPKCLHTGPPAAGSVERQAGEMEPAGYYEKHKTFYKRGPQEVDRLVYPHQREGCERVTKLTARTFIGWVGSGLGVVAVSGLVFSALALWKKDKQFEREVAAPLRRALGRD